MLIYIHCNYVIIYFVTVGSCTTKALRMFKLMNVACVSSNTFYHQFGCYIAPVIIQLWKEHQRNLMEQSAEFDDGIVLSGDGRCDSPGHSAKFGSFTVIEQQMNRVLDFQLVQVGFCIIILELCQSTHLL